MEEPTSRQRIEHLLDELERGRLGARRLLDVERWLVGLLNMSRSYKKGRFGKRG